MFVLTKASVKVISIRSMHTNNISENNVSQSETCNKRGLDGRSEEVSTCTYNTMLSGFCGDQSLIAADNAIRSLG